MKIAVIMLTFNRLELTKQAIEGFFNDKSSIKPDIYIVDQGSTDGTVEYLETLADENPRVHVICLNANVGIARGMGLAYMRAIFSPSLYDFIIKIDNDIRFITPKVFDEVVKFYDKTGHLNIVIAPNNADIDPEYIPPAVSSDFTIEGFAPTTHVGGLFMVMPLAIVKDYLKEAIVLHAPIERDDARGLWFRERGYLVGYVSDIEVGHIGEGKSTEKEVYRF